MQQWTYELDIKSDMWNGGVFDSREEAIEEANSEATNCGIDVFKIGIVKMVEGFGIDAGVVIERMQEEMYSEYDEPAEDYLCLASEEQVNELESKLNEVFFEWQEKHGHKPNFYTIINEEVVKVK